MLENLRKQGASTFVWIVFAILIAAFVVGLGQQQSGAQGGCSFGGGQRVALKVGGNEVDDTGLRLAVNLGGYLERGGTEGQTRRAFERLIRREILASEAARRGLRVPEGLVDDAIVHGKLHLNNLPGERRGPVVDARGLFFSKLRDDSGAEPSDAPVDPADTYFNYDQFERILRNMNITVAVYKREQTREILASTMARIFIRAVPASREEAQAQYVSENTRVSFSAVRFDSNKYADALVFTDGDVDRFIKGHKAEVQAAYSADAYKGKKQVHLRRVFIARAPLPPAPTVTPQPADGSPGPAPVPPPKPDPGKAKLEALRAQLVAGKRGFSEVAEATDTDPRFAARGGDWGWHDEGAVILADPALTEEAGKLERGKVSPVIEGADGFYLLMIDDRREGDLAIDQVQRELALPLAKAAWGKEAARRAAIAAVAAAKGGKSLSELYPGPKTGHAPSVTEIVSDRPVMWGQAGDGSAPAAPAAGDPAAPAAGDPAVPAAGDPASPPVPAGPPPIMQPTNELLPKLGAVEPPSVEGHEGIVRSGDATPLGESRELARALYDELAVGPVAERIFEVRGSVIDPMPQYVLVQLTAKDLADIAKFEKQADRLVERLATVRGFLLLEAWMRERCAALDADGRIKPTWAYLQTYNEKNDKLPIDYKPCESMAQVP